MSVDWLRIPVIPIVADMRVTTGEDLCACANHVFRPCELLAVKNKSLPVFIKPRLAVSALFHKSLDAILLTLNLIGVVVDDTIVSFLNIILIFVDFPVVVIDTLLEILDVVCEPHNLHSESF